MAAAIVSSASLRFKPYTAIRFISFYTTSNRRKFPAHFKTLIKTLQFPPFRRAPSSAFPREIVLRQRSFCTVTSGVLSPNAKTLGYGDVERIFEFKKRTRIVDIKRGPDEGLDKLGLNLLVSGWVRTIWVQSSVIFIEVNDGSCLPNMQCVVNSDAEGYGQVESGLITTGTSIFIRGTIVSSQGSKQKVQMKVVQIATVARVRRALVYSIRKFLHENGSIWVSTPNTKDPDCERAREQFFVTTPFPSSHEATASPASPWDAIPKTK